jgi:hypothetical protein
VEHRNADTRQVAERGASGDDATRFLRELRQLRDGAGLGQAELAARAHFPFDSIRAAEIGPGLPDLPVLCAYVRGCGGTSEEWEERWRSLTSSPSLPVSASRNAGRSDAATAGARIGSVSQIGDNPDPSIIIAALSRVADEMASPGADPLPASPDAERADDFPPPEAPFPVDSDAFPPLDAFPPASDAFPPPPDPFPSATEAFPSAPEPFPSATEGFPPAPEPVTSDKPAGWDPIRVSTAWPAIRDAPTAASLPPSRSRRAGNAGPATSAGTPADTGMGVPWGTPRPEGRVPAAPSRTPQAGRATSGAARRGAVSGSARSASWPWIAVIAAVLLCVLAVLLAVFA